MSSTTDFLAGTKVLEEANSPVNGKLTVIRDLAWGTHIKGGGLTQSGGVAMKVWKTVLQKLQNTQSRKIKEVLILGLGGGGIISVLKKHWPDAKITGVDIDPVIVELGKKYMGLKNDDVEIVIQDAFEFLAKHNATNTKHFDLICVDTYVGDQFPDKFETDRFLTHVRSHLAKDGTAVFNRLYYGEKRKEAEKFHKKLIHTFKKVTPVYPEANVMFVCTN